MDSLAPDTHKLRPVLLDTRTAQLVAQGSWAPRGLAMASHSQDVGLGATSAAAWPALSMSANGGLIPTGRDAGQDDAQLPRPVVIASTLADCCGKHAPSRLETVSPLASKQTALDPSIDKWLFIFSAMVVALVLFLAGIVCILNYLVLPMVNDEIQYLHDKIDSILEDCGINRVARAGQAVGKVKSKVQEKVRHGGENIMHAKER
eukprot:CAMPEP_0117490930 /NCGR_PEP_ID=MMETSP0784-20121206/17802_1 /TAXON_ID=39447 /ORGANISM="" /LENGTH=204 /DNA_ID=CAMNT_0005285699 /DNA_START=226 /DNA_END=837 /DNA_ORIENTATION=-